MWSHRNEILHSPEHEWKLQEKIQLQPKIEALLSDLSQTSLQHPDSELILPLAQILDQDLDFCKQWIGSATKALARKRDSTQG